MKLIDKVTVKGKIETIRASLVPRKRGWTYDPKTGLWLKRHVNKNIVTLAGLSFMAKSIQYGNADAGKTIRYMGVGTGSTVPTKSDTALVAEVARVEIDSWDNSGIAADPVEMIATHLFTTSEANGDLMEVALFQASSGAPMYCRGLFGYGLITNATNAEPVVIESVEHGLTDGDMVYITGVEGMTELNGNAYFVDVLTADTFALYSDDDLTIPVDGTGYGVYSDASPNTANWKVVIPKTVSETLTVNYALIFPVE